MRDSHSVFKFKKVKVCYDSVFHFDLLLLFLLFYQVLFNSVLICILKYIY